MAVRLDLALRVMAYALQKVKCDHCAHSQFNHVPRASGCRGNGPSAIMPLPVLRLDIGHLMTLTDKVRQTQLVVCFTLCSIRNGRC